MIFRRDAAALGLSATVVAVGLLALCAGAGLGATADVKLQVVPRGPGTVKSSVPDKRTGETACTKRTEPGACDWTFTQGDTVVLTATPNGAAASFEGWSTPDCPATAECRLTVGDDQTVVALFSKLTLQVQLSGNNNDDELVTSDPAGIRCPPDCTFDFDARSVVKLTVDPGSSTLTSFPFGCTSVQGRDCIVTMLDDPQTVGVKFNSAGGPSPPDVVEVSVRVRKTGNGTGRVTATGFNCGDSCSAKFKYGTLEPFTVAADPGSFFDGWGGICASDKELRCTLPIGPITLILPKFVKQAPPLRVQFLGASIVRAKAVRRLVVRLRSSAATKGTGTLFVGGKRIVRTGVAFRAGANALSYRMPRGSGRRNVRLLLQVANPAGGVKTLNYRVTVRT